MRRICFNPISLQVVHDINCTRNEEKVIIILVVSLFLYKYVTNIPPQHKNSWTTVGPLHIDNMYVYIWNLEALTLFLLLLCRRHS